MTPTSAEDVASAMTAPVSSGILSTTNAVVPASDRCLKVKAATTLGELGKLLVGKVGWFLPLGDNLSKSVVSTVMSSDEGFFVRSQGLLKYFVKTIHFIDEEGENNSSTNVDDLANLKEQVITSFEFECKMKSESMSCIRFYIPYTKIVFKKLMEQVLQQPPSYDLHILVRKDVHGIPFVCATVACNGDFDAEDCVVKYLTDCENGTKRTCKDASEVVEASLEAGFSGFLEYYNLDCTMYARELSQEMEETYCNLIEDAFGNNIFGPEGKMIAGVRRTAKGGLEAQAYWYTAKAISDLERESLKPDVESVMGPPVSSGVLPQDASLPPSAETRLQEEQSDLKRKRDLIAPRIPNFKGNVYVEGDRKYAASKHQYASSSYPNDQNRMSPHMAAYPLDANDVIAAILYAKGANKKIVARSGGHQYCGLSSGGNDTIMLIMEKFNKLKVIGNIAVVGPGCRLVDIAKAFKKAGVTIPHGECPFVCIGGHVQTGGYGHLLRSFGLALDHVKSFDMVLSNGTLKTFTREERDDLYWAVLGGGPGSFGVITEITFDCIKDVDHPKSFGYNGVFKFEKEVMRRTMHELTNWANKINKSDASFPEDVDLVVSATSHSWNPLRPFSVMLLEMVHGNFKGVAQTVEETERARKVFQDTLDTIKTNPQFLLYDAKRSRSLSDMSDSFVRQVFLGTTIVGDQGREFSFPYMKRLNVFEKPLTLEFVDAFTELVDDVINDPEHDNIKVVTQVFLGGGQVRKLGGEQSITSISGRNYTVGIVFDIFYKNDNKESGMKDKAETFQKRMGDLVEKELHGEREIRMQWGSFGDTNMNDVWHHYYDDEKHYKVLQKIKEETDPADMFHTSFTVQLPPADLKSHGNTDGSDGNKKRKTK